MPKKKSTKAVRSIAPASQNAFQAIEDLLQSLDNSLSRPQTSAITKGARTTALAVQNKNDQTGMRWSDLWATDVGNEEKSVINKQSNGKKGKSKVLKAKTKPPPSSIDPNNLMGSLQNMKRLTANENLHLQANGLTEGGVVQLEPVDSTYSDEEDTHAFLEKVQQLANLKKKVCWKLAILDLTPEGLVRVQNTCLVSLMY